MTKLKKKVRLLPLATMCLLVLGGAGIAGVLAQRQFGKVETGRPEVKVNLSGTVEREAGKVAIEKNAVVNPGEILDWTITSENSGTGPAREYKAVGQIPRGTSFVAGSATSQNNANVLFSIDGGRNFSAQPLIEEKQADGTLKRTPAPVSMYTQVQYEWSDPLAEGGKLSASYKVRVK